MTEPAQSQTHFLALAAGFARTFALRFLVVYLIIYIVPFPFGTLPYTGWPAELVENLKHWFVPLVGRAVFGVAITIFPGGSGDTTYNYVEVFCFALIALVIGLAWTVAVRGRPVSSRTLDVARITVRYCLGATMLGYGWDKVVPLQFPSPGPDRLLMAYGDSSPMGLLWTFMGASKAYVVFSGFLEVAGGLLILFRRTALLGGLLSAAVLTNILLMNLCYDVPVKLFSAHLLLMALFVVAPDAARLLNLFLLNAPVPAADLRVLRLERPWARRGVAGAKLAFIFWVGLMPAYFHYQEFRGQGTPGPAKPWTGVYRVESFIRDGVAERALPDDQRWVRVGISSTGLGVIVRADGSGRRQSMEFNESKGTVTITRRGETNAIVLTFARCEPGVMLLQGQFEGATVSAHLRLQDEARPLLTSRGFHWINEFPYNR